MLFIELNGEAAPLSLTHGRYTYFASVLTNKQLCYNPFILQCFNIIWQEAKYRQIITRYFARFLPYLHVSYLSIYIYHITILHDIIIVENSLPNMIKLTLTLGKRIFNAIGKRFIEDKQRDASIAGERGEIA